MKTSDHIRYEPHGDSSPEHGTIVFADIYALALRRYEEKAATANGGENAEKGSKHARRTPSLPNP